MALELSVDIVARFAKMTDALEKIGRDSEKTARRIDAAFSGLRGLAGFFGVALGVHAFTDAIDKAIESMDQLNKASERTGVAVETLSALKYAAQLSNISFEQLEKGLVKLSRGVDDGGAAFRRLGINIKGVTTPDQAFIALAEAVSKTENGIRKAAIVVQALGKDATVLIPVLNLGADGLARLRDEAQALGLIITPEQAKAAETLKDAMTRLKAAGEGLSTSIANALVPALTQIVDKMNEAIKRGGILAGILTGIAQSGKIALQGGPDLTPLEHARQDVAKLRAELEKLHETQKAVRETPTASSAQLSPRFAGALGKLTLPSEQETRNKIAEKERTLADAERLLKREEELDKAKKKLGEIPPKFIDRSALERADLKNVTDLAKQSAQQRQQIDDIFFARGETAIKDYYEQRLRTTRESLQAEIEQVIKSIGIETGLLGHAETPEQQVGIEARIKELKGLQVRLTEQSVHLGTLTAEQRTDAENAFADSIVSANIALQEQLGFSGKAAALERDLVSFKQRRQKIENELAIAIQTGNNDKARELQIALQTFDVTQREKEVRADLTLTLGKEATARQLIDVAIQEADTARVAAGGGFEAEKRFLDESVQQHLALAQALHREADALEAAAKQQVKDSPEQKKTLAEAASRRTQAHVEETSASPAVLAHQDLQAELRKTNFLLDQEAIAEADINNLRESGAITTLDQMERIDRARQDALGGLKAEYESLKAIAELTKNPEDVLAAERARVAIERLGATANEVGKQAQKIFEDAFVSPFEDLINHTKSADEALKAFFNNIAQSFLHLISQNLAEKLFGSLFGTSKSGGGGVDILGSIFGLFSGGGAGGGATVPAAQRGALGMVMTAEGPMHLSRFASGGIARRPQLAMFGEGRMPEAYVPLPDGRSIPVTMQGGGGGTRVQAGPSAIVPQQQWKAPAVTLQLHPDAMHMTLRDWFEGEMARTLASR